MGATDADLDRRETERGDLTEAGGKEVDQTIGHPDRIETGTRIEIETARRIETDIVTNVEVAKKPIVEETATEAGAAVETETKTDTKDHTVHVPAHLYETGQMQPIRPNERAHQPPVQCLLLSLLEGLDQTMTETKTEM